LGWINYPALEGAMSFDSVSVRRTCFSFQWLIRKTGPVAIRTLSVFWLGSFFAAAPQPQSALPTTIRQAGKLELHQPVERNMGPGQVDLFTLNAGTGQFLRVVADQKGVNIWLHIIDPEGNTLVTADRPGVSGGPQSASAIIPRSGLFQIKVEMAPDAFGAGQYAIEMTDLRDPTEKDRLRIGAETKLFAAIAEAHAADPASRRKAIEHYTEVASLWRDLQDGFEQASCLNGIGVLYAGFGEYQKALEYYQQALSIRHQLGYQSGEGVTLGNMGSSYLRLGEKQKALEYYQQALALDHSVGNRVSEASALNGIGDVYSILGEKQKAKDTLTQALALSREIGDRANESRAIGALNSLYRLPPVPAPGPAAVQLAPRPGDLQVQLMAQSGHGLAISAIAFSPNGQFVLTASDEPAAILWSVDEGKEIRKFEVHENDAPLGNAVISVAFLPDGNSIVTGSSDKTVRIWDVHTGREIRRLTDSMAIGSLSVSPDGGLIATAGGGIGARSAHLWDTRSGKNIRSFDGHADAVRAVAFSPDGKRLATASADRTARLWDIATGTEVRRFTSHESKVNAIAFSPDGALLATGSGATDGDTISAATSRDPKYSALPIPERMKLASEEALKAEHVIRVWDLNSGTEISRIDAPAAILALAFSPNSRYLASGGGNSRLMNGVDAGCEVRIVDARSGKSVSRFAAEEKQSRLSPIRAVAFSPNSMLLARGAYKEVVITSTDSGTEVSRLRGYAQPSFSLSISGDNRFTVTGGPASALWDHQTGRPGPTYTVQSPGDVFSPEGSTLVNLIAVPGSPAPQIRFWDLRTNSEIRHVARPGAVPQAFSPDGRSLLVGTAQQLCLIETSTGAEVRCLQDSSGVNAGAFFSSAGDAIIAFSRMAPGITVHVWDTKNPVPVRSFKSAGTAAAVSPVGEAIAVGYPSTRLYNWKTGELIRELFTGQVPAVRISFSPNGRWLAVAPVLGNASVWDTTTGEEKLEFPLSDHTSDVKFSADGRFVFSSGSAGITSVWDFATGKQVCALASFNDGSWAVTDPDGRYDASNPDEAIGLHWVAGTEVIELGQLKQRFYAPGLFARVLKGERLPDVASIRTVKLFPKLEVQELGPGSTHLNLKLTNRGGGIGRVVVKVNGKEIPSGAHAAGADPDASTAQVSIDLGSAVRAADGRNAVEVIAYDGRNLLSSRGITVIWKTDAPAAAKPPRLFAVVAGVSEYDNPELNLMYPAKDAESMYQALRLAGEGLFGKGMVSLHLLSTSGSPGTVLPTKEEFRRAFGAIAGEADSQDVLVIYLAGHGVARRGIADQYYYLTKSARNTELPANDLIMLDLATVSSEELRNWSLNIKALKQVIILDTCAAGAAREELIKLASRRDLSPDQARAMELLKDSTGSHILMGSATDAVSYEASRYGQGLLTYALLQGMKGEALDEGKSVDVLKLFNFVSNRVVQLAYGIGGIQQPQISSPGGRSFPIGLLSDADKLAIPLANAKLQLLRVQCYDSQDVDSLGLAQLVRARLKEASQPVNRGDARAEPALVYVDEALDVPSAISPLVRYRVQDRRLEARIILRRDNQILSNDSLTVNADTADAARQITDAIVKAATKVGGQ
jgi:WD40 repeat protein/Tfp pilus assembly protein PilF